MFSALAAASVALSVAAGAQSVAPFALEVSPQTYGAKADFQSLQHLSMIQGSATIQASTPVFGAGDVGKTIFVISPALGTTSFVSVVTGIAANGTQALVRETAPRSFQDAAGGFGNDDSVAVQQCWDESSARGALCRMPAGDYLLAARPLVIRRHLDAEGAAPEATSLVCAPSLRDCVVLDDGPVQFVSLRRLEVRGSEGAEPPPAIAHDAQRGLVLIAHGQGNAGGGLWQSSFAHLQLSDFWGDELVLQGGTGEAQHPNQFLLFEDLELQAARGSEGVGPPADSVRLRMLGQNAQIRFTGGQIHGSIGSQLGRGVLIDGAGVVRFEGTTCEWVDRCLEIVSGTTIRFTDGWVENAKHFAVLGPGPLRGVTLDHNYLANSCFDLRTHTGACVEITGDDVAGVSFTHNVLAWGTAPPDRVVLAPKQALVEAGSTLENGVLRDRSVGMAVLPGANGGSTVRVARGSTGWLAPRQTVRVQMTWSTKPFSTDDFTPTCTLLGTTGALELLGIVRESRSSVEVAVRNSRSVEAERSSIRCVGIE